MVLFGLSTVSAKADVTDENNLYFNHNSGLTFDKNTDSFIKKHIDLNNSNESSIKDMEISSEKGEMSITGILEYEKEAFNLDLHGNIYPSLNGGDVIYGDLKGTDEFKVVHLQIAKSPPKGTTLLSKPSKTDSLMILVLENRKNGDLIYNEVPMPKKDYDFFKKESELNIKDISNSKHEDIISDISIMNRNRDHYSSEYDKELVFQNEEEKLLNRDDNTYYKNRDNAINNNSSLNAWKNISVNRKELERMTRDLIQAHSENQYKWIKRSDYNIPKSLFDGNGHKKDENGIDKLYAHTISNVNVNWTAITRLQTMFDQPDDDRLEWEFQLAIAGEVISDRTPIIVEYNDEEDLIRLRYQNRGVKIKDNHMFLELSPNKAVFNQSTPNGTVAEFDNQFTLRNILGVIKYTSTITDVLGLLADSKYYTSDKSGVPRNYYKDFDEQEENYGKGNVIKVVSADFNDTSMYSKAHMQRLDARVSLKEGPGGKIKGGWSASFIGHF